MISYTDMQASSGSINLSLTEVRWVHNRRPKSVRYGNIQEIKINPFRDWQDHTKS